MKKFFLILCLMLFCTNIIFALVPDTSYTSGTSTSEEDTYWKDEHKNAENNKDSINNQTSSKKNEATDFATVDVEKIISESHDVINNFMNEVVKIHNKAFGINDNKDPYKPPFNLQRRLSDFKTGKIFNLLLAFFLIFSSLRYGFKIATRGNVQSSEIVGFIIKTVFIFIIFYIMPYIPTMLWKLAFYFSEIITGTDLNTLGFGSAIQGPTLLKKIFGSAGALGAVVLSLFGSDVGISLGAHATIHLDLSSLSILGVFLFVICFASLIATYVVALQFCWKIIDLYLINIALVFFLPASLYEGLGMKLKSIFQTFYKNFVELIICSIFILLINKMNILDTLVKGSIWVPALKLFLRPALLIVGMHYGAKIASVLPRGEVTDTDSDVQGAVSTVGKAFFGGSVLTSTVNKIKSSKQQKNLRNIIQSSSDNSNNKKFQT